MKLDVILVLIGANVFFDGVSSLWHYDGKETFWRNQVWRVWRCVLGIVLIVIGFMND